MGSVIAAVSHYLPEKKLTNVDLSVQYPDWPVEKIHSKTGISERLISADDEYSLELGEKAAKKLFVEHNINGNDIDFIIFCSQTPKYLIATSACILQHKLGVPTTCGALDVNLGCSGYVYSLSLADALITSKRAKQVLVITADTYTKLIASDNRQLKTLFSDGATASLIKESETDQGMQSFVFGSDGAGAEKLISKTGGTQGLVEGVTSYQPDLYMDGADICTFVLGKVPKLVDSLLNQSKLNLNDIDLFIFHQANSYILDHLKQKIGIAPEKFYLHMENVGNTVSSTIPIALENAIKEKKLQRGNKLMLVGFGVGFSWGGVIIDW